MSKRVVVSRLDTRGLFQSGLRKTGELPGLESDSWRLNHAWPAFITFEHDPFGKPVPTFPDHALGDRP